MSGYRKKQKTAPQYSKVWMTRWQIFCMFWCSIYLIADIRMNSATNAVTIVNSLIVSVVACMIPYFAKSFLESKEEKRLEFEKEKYKVEQDFNGSVG